MHMDESRIACQLQHQHAMSVNCYQIPALHTWAPGKADKYWAIFLYSTPSATQSGSYNIRVCPTFVHLSVRPSFNPSHKIFINYFCILEIFSNFTSSFFEVQPQAMSIMDLLNIRIRVHNMINFHILCIPGISFNAKAIIFGVIHGFIELFDIGWWISQI